jgi:hypothetical protein
LDELGVDFNNAVGWFQHQQDQPYVLIKLTQSHAKQLISEMAVAVRRCYITDQLLVDQAAALGLQQSEVLASRLPDPSATMAGDFGEILCYVYQSSKELPAFAIGAKKWRLKQDRTKPAPLSDVVHFLMPARPSPSVEDAILCAEVKLKSTAGASTPIVSAIEDCAKDRTSRLARTLVWLRERAMTEQLGDVDLPLLNRFINLVENPPVSKRFRAVAVVCDSLVEQELHSAPNVPSSDYSLIVIVVPNLKQTYEAAFAAVHTSISV